MTLPPLPCPFCGSTNIRTDDARDFLACMDCHTEGPCNIGMGSNYAVEAWNRRAAIAAHVPEAGCGNIAAVPASLTDEQIDAVTLAQWGAQIGAMLQAHRSYARAVLAAAPQAVPVPAVTITDDPWHKLYRRAINEANGLTNYVEDRPELRGAERRLAAIEAEARTLAATFEPTPEKKP